MPVAVHLKSSHLKSVNHGLVFLFRIKPSLAADNCMGQQCLHLHVNAHYIQHGKRALSSVG
jgi:hypothetical protein